MTEAASEEKENCSKLLLYLAEPIPEGSDDGHIAGPIREVGNASVMTFLRRK